MIVVDLNLLLYAINADAPLHGKAKAWLEAALSGTETIGIPWTVILGFIRLTTRPGIFAKSLEPEAAFEIVEAWLAEPLVIAVEARGRHLQTLRDLLVPVGTAGNLTSDAHLAALAIEHGAELYSADSDFARFVGLRWRNPLA